MVAVLSPRLVLRSKRIRITSVTCMRVPMGMTIMTTWGCSFRRLYRKARRLEYLFWVCGSNVRPVGVEPVTDIVEGSDLVAATIDFAENTPEVGHVAQNMEIVPVVAPSFDTFDRLV
ncbi:unnamed protein product [Prunus armeniaca]|uniref:Uncharacterized protein n=1 Tax=Prunus armeniaca TaxID=36596 RepID=A0A6J5VYP7_PRUAR|nr:unnamed protein product [Prunus armeniaca]